MRTTVVLAAALALAGCGGGGGGGSATSPQQPAPPTQAPQSTFVTPQFIIVIPSGKTGPSATRAPKYVSSATLSVQITLTADSAGINPATIGGNPATTTITPGSCSSGCTVNGPPTPPGTDSFRIVTYDNSVPASGHALNAGQLTSVTITAGQNNPQNVTLGAIPATLTISGIPSGGSAFTAGTQSQQSALTVVAADAAGVTIPTGQSILYVDATGATIAVTVTDPDTNMNGSCISFGPSSCSSGTSTSAAFEGPDRQWVFAYNGLAENPVLITATASTASNGTATFQPKLNAPVLNASQASPSGVAQTGSPEIDLFANSGIGSTGSESFTESGWTNAPYNNALHSVSGGGCKPGAGLATSMSQIATISAGANSTTNGTPFTATAVSNPTVGSCPATISDGLSLNTTEATATLTVTYTSASVNGSAKARHSK